MAAPVLGPASRRPHPTSSLRLPRGFARAMQRAEATLGRPRLLIALLVVYLPFFVVYFAGPVGFSLPHAAAACGGQPVLDQRWGYSAQQVAEYLRGCGADGRAAIGAQQVADLAYPALFAAVLTVAMALLLRAARAPERHWAHALVLLPTISALADYTENVGIRVLLAAYPEQPSIVPAMSAVTSVKLATGWAGTALLVVLAVTAVVRRRGSGRSPVQEATAAARLRTADR